jgi:hypothetical protein
MAVLTGEEVVSGVAINVRSAFSEAEIKKIYKNKPVQGMEKPCVFVHQINADQQNELRGRANRNFLIDVRVHPEDSRADVNSWARVIAERVINAINKIQVSGQQVKARSTEWNVTDGVLHVIMGYSFKVVEVAIPYTKMETLHDNTITIRKGE